MALVGGGVMKKKVLLKGPVLTRSGYGEQTRFALRALRSREDLFDIHIQPLQWGKTSWISLQDDERDWIDQKIEKTIAHIQSGGQYDVSVQVTIPNEWERIATTNIGYTAGIESNKVAPVWLQKGNESVDRIIVVSEHSKNVYLNTTAQATNTQTGEAFPEYRLMNPIEAVGYPTKKYENLPDLDLELSTDFNFLAVAQFGPRKNLPNTIKWFVEEFKDNENVGLVVKSNISKNCLMDREKMFRDLKEFINVLPEHKCKVYLLHGDMTDEEMHSLYLHEKISAFLALPHGEGFGLPIFEAAYSGLPVVSVVWSGQSDFLTHEGSVRCYEVGYDLQPVQQEVVWNDVLIKDSMWAFAREQSAKEKMRQCYEDITNNVEGSIASQACEYGELLHDKFSTDKMYAQFVENIFSQEEVQQIQSEIDGLLADLL